MKFLFLVLLMCSFSVYSYECKEPLGATKKAFNLIKAYDKSFCNHIDERLVNLKALDQNCQSLLETAITHKNENAFSCLIEKEIVVREFNQGRTLETVELYKKLFKARTLSMLEKFENKLGLAGVWHHSLHTISKLKLAVKFKVPKDIIYYLLRTDSDPNGNTHSHRGTVLMAMIKNSYKLEVIRELVLFGADVHIEDRRGDNAFSIAAKYKTEPGVINFLFQFANQSIYDKEYTIDDINRINNKTFRDIAYSRARYGVFNLLDLALIFGNNDMADYILDNDKIRPTPTSLLFASGGDCDLRILKRIEIMLKNTGVDFSSFFESHAGKIYPLHAVSDKKENFDKDKFEYIYKRAANTTYEFSANGSLLNYLVRNGNHVYLERVLSADSSRINLTRKRTPLSEVLYSDCYKCAKVLIRFGSNVNSPAIVGSDEQHLSYFIRESSIMSPQFQSERRIPYRLFDLLIRNGANINHLSNDKGGKSPLMFMAEAYWFDHGQSERHVEFLLKMITRGGDINLYDKERSTALMHSLSFPKDDIVKILLQAGARVNETNIFGFSPLMYAAAAPCKNQKFKESDFQKNILLPIFKRILAIYVLRLDLGTESDLRFGSTTIKKGSSALDIAKKCGALPEILNLLI